MKVADTLVHRTHDPAANAKPDLGQPEISGPRQIRLIGNRGGLKIMRGSGFIGLLGLLRSVLSIAGSCGVHLHALRCVFGKARVHVCVGGVRASHRKLAALTV